MTGHARSAARRATRMPPRKTPTNLDDEIAFVMANLRYLEPWKRRLVRLLTGPNRKRRSER